MASNSKVGVWNFGDPLYQQRLRSLKRSKYGIFGSIIYPEPRHLVVVACFFATLTAYVERTGFSIAYTVMAKDSGIDEGTKGTVMSAFYWGYGISQIPGGMAAHRYGGDVVLTTSFLLWSTASLFTPGTATNSGTMILARFIVGVSQGFLIPSVHTVLSLWIPAKERAKAVSLTTSGMYLGSAAAMQMLPVFSSRFGASSILRLVGILGLGWLLVWRSVVRSIKASGIAPIIPVSTAGRDSDAAEKHSKRLTTPWKQLILSSAVWSIVINNFTFHYAFYIVMNWLPTYFDKILHTPIASVGMAKTLPYLAMFFASNLGGWFGDYLIHKRGLPVGYGRKAVNTLGFVATAAALMMMAGATTVTQGILYTTTSLGFCGFARGGFSVNHMDIAPKYAGVVMCVKYSEILVEFEYVSVCV